MRGKRNYPGSPVIPRTVTIADTKTLVTDSHDTPSIADNVIGHGTMINMQHYQDTVTLWRRVWQHSLTQMMLLSIQAFCGPAMADAITGLGGGGLASTRVSNISNAIGYATLAIVCCIGGPLVNKIGIKWAFILGSMSFPVQGLAYYCNSKCGNKWYLILSGAISGVGTACWYVAGAGAIMTLAPSGARGKYLALWIVSRNLGHLSKNVEKGVSGGVTSDTFIAFVIIECLALPFALLITPFERVVRSDGTRIVTSETLSTKMEFKHIAKTMSSKVVMFSALWALRSFFYGGTWSTYLGTYFTVRARALSSLISPFLCIIGCFGLGFILDMKGFSQRRRAQIGLYPVIILNVAVYIWSIIMQVKFDHNNPGAIDWDDGLYASSFLPYFFVQTTGPLSQSYMYWLMSSFATDAQENVRNGTAFRCIEAAGQAVAYGMNTQIETNPLVEFCVTFALLGASVIPVILLVNTTPDRIPADLVAEEQNAALENIRDV